MEREFFIFILTNKTELYWKLKQWKPSTQRSRKRIRVITQQSPQPYNKDDKNDIHHSSKPYNKGSRKKNTEKENQEREKERAFSLK